MKKKLMIIISILLLLILSISLIIVYNIRDMQNDKNTDKDTQEVKDNKENKNVIDEPSIKEEDVIIPEYIELSEESKNVLKKYGILLSNGSVFDIGYYIDFFQKFNNINGTFDEQNSFLSFFINTIRYVDYNDNYWVNTITYGDTIQYTDINISQCVGDVLCKHVDINKLKEYIYNYFGIENFDINRFVSEDRRKGFILENNEYYYDINYNTVGKYIFNYYLSEEKFEDRTEIVCQLGDSEVYKKELPKYKIVIKNSRITEINAAN